MAISEKPWSDFQQSDYTLEEWARACLIHLESGKPTAKGKHKLPVLEPNGSLNRNALGAAAGALAGARGGLTDVPSGAKKAAARSLVRLYGQAQMQAPDNLRRMAMG